MNEINISQYIKKCPGTPNYICCGYHILDIAKSCPFQCSYCYLNFYLKSKKIIINKNISEIPAYLDNYLLKLNKILRIGTGEFTDSCFSNEILQITLNIIKQLKQKNYILELKTKNADFNHNLFAEYKNNIMFSFSLNTEFIADKFEKKASSIKERIYKIKQIQKDGFLTGIHFDPIIHYKNWKKDYKKVIDQLSNLNPDKIIWMSLGTLRFRQDMLNNVLKMSDITKEFIIGLDKKYRYFRDDRIEIYSAIKDYLYKSIGKNICIYLCMESNVIWKQVFNKKMNTEILTKYLDDRVNFILR